MSIAYGERPGLSDADMAHLGDVNPAPLHARLRAEADGLRRAGGVLNEWLAHRMERDASFAEAVSASTLDEMDARVETMNDNRSDQ